jgi:radical SAM superfamily enzyme YgiQ (UPF0313 family)
MKVALFNPDFPLMGSSNLWDTDENLDYMHPPIGLISIATACLQHGFEAFVFDLSLSGDPDGTLKKIINEYQPDVVGLSAFTCNEAKVIQYARYCKEQGIRVVVGGHAVSSDIERSHQFKPVVDAIIIGEGEYPFAQLLKAWNNQSSPEEIPGVILSHCGTFTTPSRIKNLDEISVYNFDLIDMNPYAQRDAMGTVTSRGCCYNCHFCSCQKMWKRRITKRSLQNIFNEIDDIVRRYNYSDKMFTFFDDTFTFDRKRVLNFCRALKNKPYRLQWKVLTRVDRVDPELLSEMVDTGCKQIVFGIEGVNNRDLKLLNKGYTEETVKRALQYSRQAGLISEGYFMMGFPWQEKEELFETVEKIKEFDLDITRLSCLTPLPGTYFVDNMQKLGMRIPIEDTSRYNYLLPIIETDKFGLREQAEAMLHFIEQFELQQYKPEKEPGDTFSRQEPKAHQHIHHSHEKGEGVHYQAAGRIIPEAYRLSSHIVSKSFDDQYLIFEYKNGSFAIINQAAYAIMERLKNCSNVGQILKLSPSEVRPSTPEQIDLYDMFEAFLDIGFLEKIG